MQTNTDSHRELLTVREVAAAPDQHVGTVRKRIRSGELPAIRLGGPGSALRIRRSELQRWLDADPGET